MRKNLLCRVGITPENFQVIAGVFYFVDTLGLPLSVLVERLFQQRQYVDWKDFASKALSVGWKPGKVRAMIIEACVDSGIYGPGDIKCITERLDILLKSL